MTNANPHKKTKQLEKLKLTMGQYRWERLCATIRVLEKRGIPYSITKLARMSKKDLMHIRTQNTSVKADYRAKESISPGQPIPLKTASELIE